MSTKIEKAVKKLEQNESIWFYYGYSYTVNVNAEYSSDDEPEYSISYHQGEMPAFDNESYSSIEELAKAALELQPDLRKWKLIEIR